MAEPLFASVMPQALSSPSGRLTATDESATSKWRVFGGYDQVKPGTSAVIHERLVWSVSPGEWTALGPRPERGDVVDLTHVRAMFRLTGEDSLPLLSKVCALDFGDGMFPDRAAARSLFAGVATEFVRQDRAGSASYLIVPSRSFGRYVNEVIVDAGREFGLTPLPAQPET